jgi:hypothetical protein
LTQAIRIGDLIGFNYQGKWTVGEVLGIDNCHPIYDPTGKAKAEFVPAFTVKIDDSGVFATVHQSSAQPPF